MTQKLYLRRTTATPTVGSDETRLLTPDYGYYAAASAQLYTRGTVAGTTVPLQFTNGAGGTAMTWISPPLSAAVTLTGTVTLNIRGKVSVAANVTLEMEVLRLDGSGNILATVVSVAPSPVPAALTTSDAAINYTATPISAGSANVFSAGQIVGVRVYIDDSLSATMSAGQTVTLSIDGGSFGTVGQGDTWVQFTESIPFVLDSYSQEIMPAAASESAGTSAYIWPADTGNIITASGIDPDQP